MPLFSLDDLHAAARRIAPLVPPTPQYAWPLLAERTGCEVWLKHENHTPAGAFKIRGGIIYLDRLLDTSPGLKGVVTATRGNHGQSIALAASRLGLASVIVVPEGNSEEKNTAMRAFGAELHIAGRDFDESRVHAARIAAERGFAMVPSFHADLVKGVATYALELFTAQPELDAVYVPIGMGSGICGLIAARDLLGLKTQIIGVVAEAAPALADSFEAGRPMPAKSAATFADGMACRDPDADAFAIICEGAARVVRVSEDEIAAAIRALFADTHNTAEGAGAAALAALLKDGAAMRGRRVGLILSGGNIDTDRLATVLGGGTPKP
ncbi:MULTISPECIES: threonine dehydratase [Rhodomicrobium]|uniref:threonine dehydratase n=1 Tax=Rhodomicrobium TaxID=1068 RepID=UPI000B4AA389|nr:MULTISPECIES: threonine dehydratase [Rhodomicrobium]